MALLHIVLDFDVEAMDALVNMDVINTTVSEAEAKIGLGWVNTGGKGPIV